MRVNGGRKYIGRFKCESDLLFSLEEICNEENIRLGVFTVIGALSCAKLGYYNQDEKKYTECVNLSKKLEVTSCTGNISIKDEKIFVHAHIMLADHNGQCYGGHLMPGSSVFAAEYYITELEGRELKRQDDSETGLSLWPL